MTSKSRSLRVALVQQPAGEDLQANLVRALAALEDAARRGAELVCFAELALTPFHPQHPAERMPLELAEPVPGPTTEAFSARARELGVAVVLNLYERDGDRAFDSSPVLGPDGALLGRTRMYHIADFEHFHERGYYAPADGTPPVYELPWGRLGVVICYDRHYPECFRALALQGADLVVVPQAGAKGEWPPGVFEAEIQAAALQNGFFVALCNRVGREPRLEFAGESFVCAPDGAVTARAAKGQAEVLLCDLDLGALDAAPARRLFLPDRRPELYRAWRESMPEIE
ncbi:MAG: carbon-nitrogen hydrolase family protein [Acidobacteria bacterium]|mgnify:CR=1 FL=1|nr:MAG: carbon-nitrogen hydrolase family protein [Acidobacteriota bacterium]REK00856.1 MAG: carbon-nitrogen hydrolase family protein [Acidobacteriota bacterium]